MTVREIATQVHFSPETIKTHMPRSTACSAYPRDGTSKTSLKQTQARSLTSGCQGTGDFPRRAVARTAAERLTVERLTPEAVVGVLADIQRRGLHRRPCPCPRHPRGGRCARLVRKGQSWD